MQRKSSSKNDFEGRYLSVTVSKRAFADKDAVQKAFQNKDFDRIVKYLAYWSFKKNSQVFLRHGFDIDDLLSICTVFRIHFAYYGFEGETSKDTNYVFMKYVNNRLLSFCNSLESKFKTKEAFLDGYLEELPRSVEILDERSLIDGNQLSKKDEEFLLQEQIEIKEGALKALKEGESPSEKEVWKKTQEIKKLKRKALASKRKESKEKAEKEKRTEEYKNELYSNIDKYRDKLAYLATFKNIEHAVRKKARSICKKSGINYIEWAENEINNKNISRELFVL